MSFFKQSILIIATAMYITSCSEAGYKFKLNTTKKVILGDKTTVSFEQEDDKAIDSLHLYINNNRVTIKENTATINTSDIGVGKHDITALAFIPGKVKKVKGFIEVFSNKKPDLYRYKIINTYPHDKKAYIQGLEYYNGYLYETTGRNGESWLRKIDLKSGEVLQRYDLSDKYFGEGMTIFNNKIYWLTWKGRKGFVFDLESFKQISEFKYDNSLEGWGLTHSDSELIKSDGTKSIWFLNPENQKEQRSIQVYTNSQSLKKLNELEYINGKIYANYWQKPLIAIIDPKNGVVDGIVNLTDLVKEVKKTQTLDSDEVLNGIAYDKDNNRLFVTGKHWDKLFEIELVK